MSFLGLDIGTSGVKAMILDRRGVIYGQSYQEYPTEMPGPGLYELNPDKVWEIVKLVIQDVVAQASGKPELVEGISVSSLGESVVCLDSKGEVLWNSLLYLDSRGEHEIKTLVDQVGEDEIFAITGHKPHAMYTLPKLMWHRQNHPDDFRKMKVFLSFGSFILHRLGAKPAIDYSLAARTLAFDVWNLCWNPQMISAAELDPSIFPTIQSAGSDIGVIDPSIAGELGLHKGIKLVLGAQDQVCAAIGAGVQAEKTAVYGMGTVHCITPVYSKNVNTSRMGDSHFPVVPFVPGKYTTYAFSFSGGSLLKWFRDQFARLEKEIASEKNCSVYELLNRAVSDHPTDLLLLPHFAGSATPTMNPKSRGALLGLSFDTKRADLYRALMEGVAYEMRLNLESLETAGIEVEELRACGGGAVSELWVQIAADVMNKPIVGLDINEAGILGTVVLCGVSLGVYGSIEAAVTQLIRPGKIFNPVDAHVEQYELNYRKYVKMYKAVGEVMGILD